LDLEEGQGFGERAGSEHAGQGERRGVGVAGFGGADGEDGGSRQEFAGVVGEGERVAGDLEREECVGRGEGGELDEAVVLELGAEEIAPAGRGDDGLEQGGSAIPEVGGAAFGVVEADGEEDAALEANLLRETCGVNAAGGERPVAGVEEFVEAGEAEGIAAGRKGFEVERAIGGCDQTVRVVALDGRVQGFGVKDGFEAGESGARVGGEDAEGSLGQTGRGEAGGEQQG